MFLCLQIISEPLKQFKIKILFSLPVSVHFRNKYDTSMGNITILEHTRTSPTLGQKSEFHNRTGGRKGKKKKSEEGLTGKELRTDARLH